MTPEEKEELVEAMARAYLASSRNDREGIAEHFTGSRTNPKTDKRFDTFQEILDAMPDGKFDQMMAEANAAFLMSSERGVKVTR